MNLTYASSELTGAGYIKKAHGHQGLLIWNTGGHDPDDLLKRESVFIRIDGLPVPFRLLEAAVMDDQHLRIRLEDIDSLDLARELSAREVFIPLETSLPPSKGRWDQYQGYSLLDQDEKTMGLIVDFLDYGGNALFEVQQGNQEWLVPVSEELLIQFDHRRKIIQLYIPEGLLDQDDA